MTEKQTTENLIGKGKAGPGRPKGKANRTTTLLKDAILQAAERAGGGAGLVGYLQAQALANPGPFMALLGKVLPTQVEGPGPNGEHALITHIVLMGPDDAGNSEGAPEAH